MLVIVCKIHTLEEKNRNEREAYKAYSKKPEFPKPYEVLLFV